MCSSTPIGGKGPSSGTHSIHDDQSLYRTHTFLLVDGRHLNTIITPAAYGLCICWTVPQPPTRDSCWTAPQPLTLYNLMDCPTASYTFPPGPEWKSMERESDSYPDSPKYNYLSNLCNRSEFLTPEYLKGVSQSVCRP